MTCVSPMRAYRTKGGGISGNPLAAVIEGKAGELKLPCGACVGCRVDRADAWAIRCSHDAQMVEYSTGSAFLTLTFDNEHLPASNSGDVTTGQGFMKSLRKLVAPAKIRFFLVMEYGEKHGRVHYHVLIFGFDFPDRVYSHTSKGGHREFTSELLSKAWPYGRATLGSVTFQSARYCASYAQKKVFGKKQEEAYLRAHPVTGALHQVEPEFCNMSTNPGLGKPWLDKFAADVYPDDFVVIGGRKKKPPRYYDEQYEKAHPAEFATIKWARKKRSFRREGEMTKERLYAKGVCLEQKLGLSTRSIR